MRYCVKLILLYLLMILPGRLVLAQEVAASLSIDTNKILIGKPVTVLLQMSQPKSLSINWPLFTDSMGQMEILQVMPVDTLKIDEDGILLRSQTITVTSFDSGTFILPEVIFNYKLPGNEKLLMVATDPLRIEVFTVPVDTTAEIRDIRPVEKAPFDPMIIIWALLAYHALLLLIALVIWYIQRKSGKTTEVSSAPVIKIPAHVVALEALTKLEEDRIWQNGNHKLYHTRLTDIVRVYIEQRWGVGALELTTDEILGNSFVVTLEKQNVEELERLLRMADLVKFAKMIPTAAENESALQLANKFVRNTAMADVNEMDNLQVS